MSTTPTLRGDGIVLRPLELADAPALFIALGDPEVQRYRKQYAHADVGETARYIGDTLARSCAAWAITENGGEALGRLALRVDREHGEFGIVLRRAAQRLGLGAKAVRLAEPFGFDELQLLDITANIDAENAASLGLFRKLGYLPNHVIARDVTTKGGARDTAVLVKSRPQLTRERLKAKA